MSGDLENSQNIDHPVETEDVPSETINGSNNRRDRLKSEIKQRRRRERRERQEGTRERLGSLRVHSQNREKIANTEKDFERLINRIQGEISTLEAQVTNVLQEIRVMQSYSTMRQLWNWRAIGRKERENQQLRSRINALRGQLHEIQNEQARFVRTVEGGISQEDIAQAEKYSNTLVAIERGVGSVSVFQPQAELGTAGIQSAEAVLQTTTKAANSFARFLQWTNPILAPVATFRKLKGWFWGEKSAEQIKQEKYQRKWRVSENS